MDCGCTVTYSHNGDYVLWCSMHEAAGELFQALMSCRYQLGMIQHPSEDDVIALRVADRAIKLALPKRQTTPASTN